REARLAGPAHAREHDEPVLWDLEVVDHEVVLAGPQDFDVRRLTDRQQRPRRYVPGHGSRKTCITERTSAQYLRVPRPLLRSGHARALPPTLAYGARGVRRERRRSARPFEPPFRSGAPGLAGRRAA